MATHIVWMPGWAPRLLRQPQAVSVLVRAGHITAGAIDDAVPVRTGSYEKHFVMGLSVDPVGVVARITIGERRWHIIEHGSVKNEAYAPIRKGVDAAGLRWAAR
jgi:hypothetical protein